MYIPYTHTHQVSVPQVSWPGPNRFGKHVFVRPATKVRTAKQEGKEASIQ